MRQQAINFVKVCQGQVKPPCDAAEAVEDLKIARDYIRMYEGTVTMDEPVPNIVFVLANGATTTRTATADRIVRTPSDDWLSPAYFARRFAEVPSGGSF